MNEHVRDALAALHQRTLELIVRGASLQVVLDALCDGIDALDPDVISTVLLADPDGMHLWPKAGRRVPDGWKRFITPLPIGPVRGVVWNRSISEGTGGQCRYRRRRTLDG